MAEIERKTKRYATDLTEEEGARIAPLFPEPHRAGRPRETDLREVLNAIRYLVCTGCGYLHPRECCRWGRAPGRGTSGLSPGPRSFGLPHRIIRPATMLPVASLRGDLPPAPQ